MSCFSRRSTRIRRRGSSRWDLNHAWGPEGETFRKDPRFAELARRIGIVEYWKQYGFPDGCSAGHDTPIVCS